MIRQIHLQIELVNRGGKMVEIVKHCAFGVPPIIIGHHLDEASFFASFVKRHLEKLATFYLK